MKYMLALVSLWMYISLKTLCQMLMIWVMLRGTRLDTCG